MPPSRFRTSKLEAECSHPKGDPERPLSPTEIETKFEALAAYGGRESATAALLDWVRSVSTLERLRLPRL